MSLKQRKRIMGGTGSNSWTNRPQGGGMKKSGLPNSLSSAGAGMMFGRTYTGGPRGLLANYKNKNLVFCTNQIGGIGSKGGGRSLFNMMDGLNCKGRREIGEERTPTPLDLTTPLTCQSVSPSVTDAWCDMNCNHTPPYCPAGSCKCNGPAPKPLTCQSVSPSVTNAWCDTNCNYTPPNCPAGICKCDGPAPKPTPVPLCPSSLVDKCDQLTPTGGTQCKDFYEVADTPGMYNICDLRSNTYLGCKTGSSCSRVLI